jgi:hypothetical protein
VVNSSATSQLSLNRIAFQDMTDEQESVDAGSETSDDTDTAQADTETSDTAEATDGAEEAAEQTNADASDDAGNSETQAPDAYKSRTGFVSGQPGDVCTCPDGRTGTIHRFDEGLICIPNADQG